MLDLSLYDRVRLSPHPPVQCLIAEGFLRFDYRKLKLEVEGLDRLPSRPVVLAMNHTDNFNYWPLQYRLHKQRRYTATWVKGKNYEHPAIATFMRWTNNIPIASRGYVITRDFVNVLGRRPDAEEYRALRDAVDRLEPADPRAVPSVILDRPRDMLGHAFHPREQPYHHAIDALMTRMMGRFIDLNRHAQTIGCDVLVFPQGTRSIRLSRGHIGLAQVATHLGATIVPIGCNGCDKVYPGGSFVSKPGHIIYRIGEPMPPEHFADLIPKSSFVPFSREAEDTHRDRFQAIVDRVMDAIDPLLDEPYRYADDRTSDGTRGTDRFV